MQTSNEARIPHGPRFLGKVLSCRGSEANVALISPLVLPRATVGKFVLLRHRRGGSIGMISEISAADSNPASSGIRAPVAKVDLMGEMSVAADGAVSFRRGVHEYPAIDDDVEMLGKDNLDLIYSSFAGHPMKIGQIQEDGGIPVYVDADSLLSKHFAVLGSTGVGKSSGTAIILNQLIKARPDVRVLLLDVHDEYGSCFGGNSTIISTENLKLPFWMFNFEEFTDALYGGRPPVLDELDILMELIPIAKGNYANLKSNSDRSLLTRKPLRQSTFTVDTPTPYMIKDLVSLIDERMGKLENRATRMVHHRLMARIETIRGDLRYAFMFENANVGGDTMASVLIQLFAGDPNKEGVTILKLAEFPGEAVDAVVCVILRLAFELGLWSNGQNPLLIVCEEAHRFAAVDHSIGFAPTRRGLSRIAKEGRKYGVHLGLISQRPAELDPTIVSQCSSLFMMRMTNERDQYLLRSAVSDAALNLFAFIPSLGTGEVVAVGEAMPLPMRFSFNQLHRHQLPQNVHLVDSSLDPTESSRAIIIERAIERWRRATSNVDSAQQAETMIPRNSTASLEEDGQSALSRGLHAALAADGSMGISKRY